MSKIHAACHSPSNSCSPSATSHKQPEPAASLPSAQSADSVARQFSFDVGSESDSSHLSDAATDVHSFNFDARRRIDRVTEEVADVLSKEALKRIASRDKYECLLLSSLFDRNLNLEPLPEEPERKECSETEFDCCSDTSSDTSFDDERDLIYQRVFASKCELAHPGVPIDEHLRGHPQRQAQISSTFEQYHHALLSSAGSIQVRAEDNSCIVIKKWHVNKRTSTARAGDAGRLAQHAFVHCQRLLGGSSSCSCESFLNSRRCDHLVLFEMVTAEGNPTKLPVTVMFHSINANEFRSVLNYFKSKTYVFTNTAPSPHPIMPH